MRGAALVPWLLLAALWVASALAWPDLPARIPSHFGASGRADRWVDTSYLSWFGPPLITTGAVLMNSLLARWLPGNPRLFNMPDKERFLALPPAYQAPVLRRLQEFLHLISAQVVVLFGLVQLAAHQVAHGGDGRTYLMGVLLVSLAALPLLAVWFVTRVQAEVTRQIRRHAGSSPGPT